MLSFISIFLFQSIYALTFTAMGDTGKDNDGQWNVSRAMKQVCEARGCAFNMLLGDNFYQDGVTSPTDPQFYNKFEKHYADIPMPFMVVLGNHDYGSREDKWDRGAHQIAYARRNPQFVLPSEYYYFERDNTLFIALDTTLIKHNKKVREQADMVRRALAGSRAKWVVVLAHHPYLSNGKHGNAGRYEGLPFPSVVNGKHIKDFMEANLCGRMDVLFSGHDHSLQILPGNSRCSGVYVVSGTGASASSLPGRNANIFQSLDLGFVLANVTDQKISLEVINSMGNTIHTHVIQK
jgi:tartrate-resistant acid phosphatase type 5